MLYRPFEELQHFWKLVSRVDVQHRKRDAAEKRLARQPDENIGIFAHRPRHGDILEGVIRLAKNKNALVLELVEMSAAQFRHVMVLLQRITELDTDLHGFILGRFSVFFS